MIYPLKAKIIKPKEKEKKNHTIIEKIIALINVSIKRKKIIKIRGKYLSGAHLIIISSSLFPSPINYVISPLSTILLHSPPPPVHSPPPPVHSPPPPVHFPPPTEHSPPPPEVFFLPIEALIICILTIGVRLGRSKLFYFW